MKLVACIALILAASGSFAEQPIDNSTGLAVAPGWEQVRAHCGACHSYQLVTANRGDQQAWLNLIRWMQQKHNLWPLPPDVEQNIVEYLASQYPAPEPSRRRNLGPGLLP